MKNMAQQPSAPPSPLTIEQQTLSTPILTFPWELIALIMSFKDHNFEIAVATTCKTLYECYKKYYVDKMALMLYDSRGNVFLYRIGIRIFNSFTSFHQLRREFISIMNIQSNIHLSEKFPKLKLLGLNHISLSNIESIFPKLTSLRFIHLSYCTMTEDHFSEMLSNCIHLEAIGLRSCEHPEMFKLPPLLKKFGICKSKMSIKLDLSLCEKLEHL
jgi:hypothetical protein